MSRTTTQPLKVNSPNVTYTETHIHSSVVYETAQVTKENGIYTVTPDRQTFRFKTDVRVPKLGVMLIGWGGNNGTTATAGVIANRLGLTWNTKAGPVSSNYFGSLTQASTVRLGVSPAGEEIHVPFKSLVPLVEPNDIVFDGWDISSLNLAQGMARAQVFEYPLQEQLAPHLKDLRPRRAIYFPQFIAANQKDRADNILTGTKQQQLDQIREDIREFKRKENLDKIIVLWTANTERFCDVRAGLNDTAENLLKSIENGEDEVSPSTIYAVASILEGCSYINGSPQNTFVPGAIELAVKKKVFIGGDDFKSGQTKVKSVLVDYLVGAGIKPLGIVSYNHLGNNDGRNLSAPEQFRSKEISKTNVVDDVVVSNEILYKKGEHPDHVVVIKYVPSVGDSKRAMDEYTSEIFMGGRNTLVIHNTCEDSLLATPLIYDLVLLTEFCDRMRFKSEEEAEYESLHPVLSVLSYLLKAPLVPEGTPVVNALFRQRACLENLFRACIGLSPESNLLLEHKRSPLPSTMAGAR